MSTHRICPTSQIALNPQIANRICLVDLDLLRFSQFSIHLAHPCLFNLTFLYWAISLWHSDTIGIVTRRLDVVQWVEVRVESTVQLIGGLQRVVLLWRDANWGAHACITTGRHCTCTTPGIGVALLETQALVQHVEIGACSSMWSIRVHTSRYSLRRWRQQTDGVLRVLMRQQLLVLSVEINGCLLQLHLAWGWVPTEALLEWPLLGVLLG